MVIDMNIHNYGSKGYRSFGFDIFFQMKFYCYENYLIVIAVCRLIFGISDRIIALAAIGFQTIKD